MSDHKKEISKQLVETKKLLMKESYGKPTDIFVPGFGWVIKDGKPTEVAEEFVREMEKQNG